MPEITTVSVEGCGKNSNYVPLMYKCTVHTCLDRIGRRKGLLLTGVCMFISLLPAVLAQPLDRFELLLVSRVLVGLTTGFGSVAQTTYITECSPRKFRGRMNTVVGITIRASMLFGMVVSTKIVFGNEEYWALLYSLELGVVIAYTVGVACLCKETPSYLILKDNPKEAERAIDYYGASDHKERLEECKKDAEINSNRVGMLLRTKEFRKPALDAFMIGFFSSMSGMTAIGSYSALMLVDAGVNGLTASYLTLATGFAALISAIFCAYVIDNFNRKSLMMWTTGGVLIIDVFIWALACITEYFEDRSVSLAIVFLTLQCAYLVVFSLGVGPIGFFIGAELVKIQARSANQSIGIISINLGGWLSPTIFLPLLSVIGAHSFSIFSASSLILLVYLRWFMKIE